jgi:hypothetical protein
VSLSHKELIPGIERGPGERLRYGALARIDGQTVKKAVAQEALSGLARPDN